ncbi:MAG: hypothetical protein AAF961_12275 [Planctomycetota bacterium]
MIRRHGRSARCTRPATVAALVLLCWLIVGEAAACPTCKEGIAESDPAAQNMAAGYFYSILFMMSMPFVILGTFGSFAYRSVRRARLALDAEKGAASSAAAAKSSGRSAAD